VEKGTGKRHKKTDNRLPEPGMAMQGEEIDTSVKNYSLQVPVSFYIIDKRCE